MNLRPCWILLLLIASVVRAQPKANSPVKVAVAANAQFVMEEIQRAVEQDSGVRLELIVSSSGKLTAQIQNGAPFDVFLSADMQYPEALHKAGFSQSPPQVYAYGSLVIWTLEARTLDKNLQFLSQAAISKIAVANPRLAPYGEAAISALKHYRLYNSVKDKLVFGESIAQVNQYVISGAAPIGFTAKSVVLDPAMQGKGRWIEIDREAYQPIAQGAVLLKNAKNPSAKKFYDFLFSNPAKAIFRKYGYLVQ